MHLIALHSRKTDLVRSFAQKICVTFKTKYSFFRAKSHAPYKNPVHATACNICTEVLRTSLGGLWFDSQRNMDTLFLRNTLIFSRQQCLLPIMILLTLPVITYHSWCVSSFHAVSHVLVVPPSFSLLSHGYFAKLLSILSPHSSLA